MLNKLKTLREEREDGFTLIELLVVILIIGILSAIAIPVFLNQRKTANDSAVQSDMKNAASQVETWITENGGTNKAIDAAVATKLSDSVTVSDGVKLAIKGNSNNYCIVGAHSNGKNYVGSQVTVTPDATKTLTYENALGGMTKGVASGAFVGACTGTPAGGAGVPASNTFFEIL